VTINPQSELNLSAFAVYFILARIAIHLEFGLDLFEYGMAFVS